MERQPASWTDRQLQYTYTSKYITIFRSSTITHALELARTRARAHAHTHTHTHSHAHKCTQAHKCTLTHAHAITPFAYPQLNSMLKFSRYTSKSMTLFFTKLLKEEKLCMMFC